VTLYHARAVRGIFVGNYRLEKEIALTMDTDRLLAKFIAYAEEVVHHQFPELHKCDVKSRIDGAAIMLAFFGLAKLTEDEDGEFVWVATGHLTSVRPLRAREDSSAVQLARE
jgi:hypothetical protein